MKHEYWTSRKI